MRTKSIAIFLAILGTSSAGLARDQFESISVSQGIVAKLNTDEQLYAATGGSFSSKVIHEFTLEYSSNRYSDKLEGVIGYLFSEYQNSDFNIKNKKQAVIAKVKYFPFENAIQNSYISIIAIPAGVDTYSIGFGEEYDSSFQGIGAGMGYDFAFAEKYLFKVDYSVMYFHSGAFDSNSNTLRLGLGYKWY